MNKPEQEEIKKLKDKYQKGTNVKLIWMEFEEPLRYGTIGKIMGIDSLGQIIVEWECGSELSLIPELDEFEII